MNAAGLSPGQVLCPNIDEKMVKNEKPLDYVKRIAFEKSEALDTHPEHYLITADTIVTVGNKILVKTQDPLIATQYQ